jgi:hypothetical protein
MEVSEKHRAATRQRWSDMIPHNVKDRAPGLKRSGPTRSCTKDERRAHRSGNSREGRCCGKRTLGRANYAGINAHSPSAKCKRSLIPTLRGMLGMG